MLSPPLSSFLGLLAHSGLPSPSTPSSEASIPYKIDNKYYSADVHIVVRELGQDPTTDGQARDDYPVLVWLLPEGHMSVSSPCNCILLTSLLTDLSAQADV